MVWVLVVGLYVAFEMRTVNLMSFQKDEEHTYTFGVQSWLMRLNSGKMPYCFPGDIGVAQLSKLEILC